MSTCPHIIVWIQLTHVMFICSYVEYEDLKCLPTMNKTACDLVPVINPVGTPTCIYCPDSGNLFAPCRPDSVGCVGASNYEQCTSVIGTLIFTLPPELVIIGWTSHWLYVLNSYIVTCASLRSRSSR